MKLKKGDKVKYFKLIVTGDENLETIMELEAMVGKVGEIIEVFDYDTEYRYDVVFPENEDVYALCEGELERV